MPRSRVLCTGYKDAQMVHHSCDKVLGFVRTPTGEPTHGLCTECFRLHLGFNGYTPEEIEELLRNAQ